MFQEYTYRGLSGISKEPAARMKPMTHCIKRGIRHERSESMKEQKYPVHYDVASGMDHQYKAREAEPLMKNIQ